MIVDVPKNWLMVLVGISLVVVSLSLLSASEDECSTFDPSYLEDYNTRFNQAMQLYQNDQCSGIADLAPQCVPGPFVYIQDACYFKLAMTSGDKSNCDNIVNQTIQDVCINGAVSSVTCGNNQTDTWEDCDPGICAQYPHDNYCDAAGTEGFAYIIVDENDIGNVACIVSGEPLEDYATCTDTEGFHAEFCDPGDKCEPPGSDIECTCTGGASEEPPEE
ncbi:MAG: hypothetical protein GF416_01565 [Candidatus Altiarchaeales archaeon]|nr:hypothetical protein [Candidatus Altiarchaeales archaeon]MBD3415803.1 hypothetical protein [Candidatus Altiarchaeales archaeon]